MLRKAVLKDLLSLRQFTTTDKALIILAVDSNRAKAIKEIKQLGVGAGLRNIQRVNLSTLLTRTKGLAVKTENGWELTNNGIQHVKELTKSHLSMSTPDISSSLRAHLSKISNSDTANFVSEAITCYEAKLFRGAVVLSWIGAVAVMYEYVVKNKLSDFNSEVARRDPKWKPAKTTDDLARMKEHDFLGILEAISVIGKSVKNELEVCLKFRNGCGHPNSLNIAEHRVTSHIETLILNVFSQF